MKRLIWAKAAIETNGDKCGVTCAFRDYAMKFDRPRFVRAWCLLFNADAAERVAACKRAERQQRRKP